MGTNQSDACNAPAIGGPCRLPRGHNIGHADVPQRHMAAYTAQEAVDAICLAVEAGADDQAKVRVIEAILSKAPTPVANDARSVWLLVESVRDGGAEFAVTEPSAR